jgi:hypothetical protein
MTSTAITVAHADLALPRGAMFHPKMLQIGVSTSREQYQQLGAGIQKIDDASQLWSCDYCLFGLRTWGKEEGLELAHAATGYTKGTCKKLAYIAERFTPERRPDGFTRAHFKALLPFPQEWLNTWLPTVANRRLTSKGVRALAIEAYGSDPSQKPTTGKTRTVRISCAVYAQLVELNATQPASLAEAILTTWLSTSPEEQSACLAAAAEIKRERKNTRHRNRIAAKKAKKAEKIIEPLDMASQLARFKKAHPEYGKDSVGTSRTVGSEPDATEPRPSYEDRRKEHIAGGAQPIKPKARKQYTSKVKIVFTECRGNSFIESTDGAINSFSNAARADRFFTLEKAEKAAAEYSADRGYLCEAFLCEPCSSIATTIWHVRQKQREQNNG